MNKLLITSALVAMTAMPVAAQDAEWRDTFVESATADSIRASGFIGARVYRSDNEINDDVRARDENWDDIGEINDVVMTRDGQIESILVDIGGFLGIGEKTVAVQMDDLNLRSDGEDADEYFVVFTAPRAMLEDVPAYRADNAEMDEMEQTASNDADMAEGESTTMAEGDDAAMKDGEKTAMAEGEDTKVVEDTTMANETNTGLRAPDITRDGYMTAEANKLTAEDLTGAEVYDANDKWVGEVSELVLGDGEKISQAVIDVGGFLGIGEKPVAMDFEKLTILRGEADGNVRVYLDATEEQLEAMETYTDG